MAFHRQKLERFNNKGNLYKFTVNHTRYGTNTEVSRQSLFYAK